MSEDNTTDQSVNDINDEVLRHSRETSRGIAFGALAEALSLSMLSTSAHHYATQTLGSSAMAATCAKILKQ